MCTDKTSGLLVATMRQVFPGLRGCALDPVHLAMAVEQPTWEKKNSISRILRFIISKFTPEVYGEASSSDFYDGRNLRLTGKEGREIDSLTKASASEEYPQKRLKSISPERGFDSRGEFMMYLSLLVTAYPELAKKKGRTSRTIKQLLKSACDPSTAEWYLNNERIRRNLSPKLRPFVAVGATGSEAINAELKLWFRGIFQIHGPILRLKLRISQVAKLKAFVSAMYRKTTHQAKQQIVLLRSTKKWCVFDTTHEWDTWCGECNVEGVFRRVSICRIATYMPKDYQNGRRVT